MFMIFKLIQIEFDIDINNDELFETHIETFKKNWLPIGSVQPHKDQMVPSYKSASCMQV